MKHFISILFILPLALTMSFGQNGKSMYHSEFEKSSFDSKTIPAILFASDVDTDKSKYNEYLDDLNTTIAQIEKKAHKWNNQKIVEKLFYKVHQKNLKWYSNYVSVSDAFENGNYDCVTGTSIYALALSKLNLPYTIYEFDYHSFLIVELEDRRILLEATDPINGIVMDLDEIDKRIAKYTEGTDPIDATQPVSSDIDTRSSRINTTINLQQLAGLQYFNLAVNAFNNKDLFLASDMIEKAFLLYPSERIADIRQVFQQQKLLTSR